MEDASGGLENPLKAQEWKFQDSCFQYYFHGVLWKNNRITVLNAIKINSEMELD